MARMMLLVCVGLELGQKTIQTGSCTIGKCCFIFNPGGRAADGRSDAMSVCVTWAPGADQKNYSDRLVHN
jgi:hypothetical protein